MRALIVDDHPVARRGLATLLRDAVDVEAIDEADSARRAVELAREHRPDLVLTDMHMPGSGPARELCAQLRALLPATAIVVVTAFDRPGEVRDCLEAGATACLLKDTSESDMVAALRSVVAGRVVIDPRVAQQMAVGLAGGGSGARAVRLTAREREVLGCLAEGRSNRQIAEQLIITEATVKGYVSSLLEKLGASSRLEAIVRAGRDGLL
jgi:DNA-binding NarL/FixJ family response regulator